jgi:hypothetical protein
MGGGAFLQTIRRRCGCWCRGPSANAWSDAVRLIHQRPSNRRCCRVIRESSPGSSTTASPRWLTASQTWPGHSVAQTVGLRRAVQGRGRWMGPPWPSLDYGVLERIGLTAARDYFQVTWILPGYQRDTNGIPTGYQRDTN